MASEKAPRPHCNIMNPIWAMVEYASERFTFVCVSMMTEAKSAVKAPTSARVFSAAGSLIRTGERRTTRNPPALMMPACMSADTGVGVSMVSGSQL